MADIKYTVDISFEEAINNAKKSGAQIKNEIEGQLKKLRDTRIEILNKDDTKAVQREIMVATDLIKKGKASAEELKAAYARGIRELKKQTKAIKGKNRALKVSLEEVKRAKKAHAEERNEMARKLRLLRQLKAGQKAYNAEIGKAEILRRKQQGSFGKGFGKDAMGIGAAFSMAAIQLRAITLGMDLLRKGVTDVVARARELSQLKVSLASFLNPTEIEGVIGRSQNLALAYGVSVQSIEKSWKRVGPAAKAAGLSLEETDQLIEATAARMAQMGLNTEQAGRYMEALGQVMGKGKLQSEELNQQFAELDGALRSQLQAYFEGVEGVENFNDALSKGEISATDFAKGLIFVSQDAMGKMKQSTQELVQNMRNLSFEQQINQINNFAAQLNKNLANVFAGLGQRLIESAGMLTSYLSTLSQRFPKTTAYIKQGLTDLGNLVKIIVNGIIVFIEALMQASEALQNLVDKIPGARMLMNGLSVALEWLGNRSSETADILSDQAIVIEENKKKWQEAIRAQQSAAGATEEQIKLLHDQAQALKDAMAQTAEKILQEESLAAKVVKHTEEVNKLIVAYKNEEAAGNSTKEAAKNLAEGMYELAKSRKELIDQKLDELYEKEEEKIDKLIAKLEEFKKAYTRRYEDGKAAIKGAQAAEDARHDRAKANIESEKRRIQELGKQWKLNIDKAINNEKVRHANAMANIESEISAVNRRYDAANEALRGPTQAEQELARLESERTRDAYRRGEITKEEMLQGQVALQRMEREAKIRQNNIMRAQQLAALEKKKNEEEKKHREEMRELENKKIEVNKEIAKQMEKIANKLSAENKKHKKVEKILKDKLTNLETQKKLNDRAVEDTKKELENRKETAQALVETAKESNTILSNFIDITKEAQYSSEYAKDLYTRLNNAAVAASKTAVYYERIAAAAIKAAQAGPPGSGRGGGGGSSSAPDEGFFTGGPMKGGETAVVNELGKEAFLTAQGHLSMINAPAWGKWKAPSSGTVIPAHLTKQLDIPAGGVNLNRKNIQNTQKSGGTGAIVKAIRQMNGGNHINNTVTVQSANPTQTANSMMVNLQKIRRIRYGR